MSLLGLLKDPSAYNVGGGSKGLDYPEGQGPLLGKRVSFDIANETIESKPNFEYGYNHGNFGVGDSFIRGGLAKPDRLFTDVKRIGKFFLTSNGIQFLAKQVILQSQNPKPQKIYNLGINTLASVASAGIINVRRGGLLPSVGDLDLMSLLPPIPGAIFENNYLESDGGDNLQNKTSQLLDSKDSVFLQELDASNYLSNFKPTELIPTSSDATSTVIDTTRESNYKLGDPTKTKAHTKTLAQGYEVATSASIDKINELPIFSRNTATELNMESKTKDFVPFRFEVVNQDSNGQNNIIVFRAFLDSVSDDYSADHNTYKYNGRGEEFYTYNKFNRKIAVSFKVAAQTRSEMKPIYQKLNYLTAQTAPNYSSEGRIRTPYMYLTVGHWFNKIPGLITSVGLAWQKDYSWEIALENTKADGSVGKDKEMLILPHVLDVNLSFQPIHSFTPSNNINSPFIGIDGDTTHSAWIADPKPTI